MAININFVYVSVRDLTLKDLGGGFLSPQQFNTYANMANVELFNKYAEVFQNEQRITDKLLPFIKRSNLGIDETGKMDYPTDYVNKIAVRAYDPDSYDTEIARAKLAKEAPKYGLIKQTKVVAIDNDKLGDRLTSSVVEPTRKYPIVTFYDSYIQWNPIDAGSGIFEYLRQPIDVEWGFITQTNGLPAYSAAASTNFEWGWMMRNELIIKICGFFGVSVREDQMVQYSNQMESKQK